MQQGMYRRVGPEINGLAGDAGFGVAPVAGRDRLAITNPLDAKPETRQQGRDRGTVEIADAQYIRLHDGTC